MFKDVLSGAKSVASAKGIGAVLATFLVFAIIAYAFNATPSTVAASAKQRLGGA